MKVKFAKVMLRFLFILNLQQKLLSIWLTKLSSCIKWFEFGCLCLFERLYLCIRVTVTPTVLVAIAACNTATFVTATYTCALG